ncbi:MAG: SprB repeat-containing protein, partial [Bacteroidetes bacterium]|nr:SprB repeat-containing protein [Bacteroidota bacterium]
MKSLFTYFIIGVLMYLWTSCTEDPAPDPCQTLPQIINVTITDASCGSNNGSLQVTASGGKGALTYSLNGSQFQQSNQFSNLAASTHVLSVQDENNCMVQQEVVIGDQNNLLVSVSASTNAGCGTANGSVTLAGRGGNGSLAFSLDGLSFQPEASFSKLAAGEHTAYVKDADGCVSSTSFTLTSGVSFEGKIKAIIDTN